MELIQGTISFTNLSCTARTELVCEVKECKLSNGCATVLRGEKTKPFLQMPVFKLIGSMHYPVIYNGVHKWHFIYNMKSPLIYFLRTQSDDIIILL